ncbi:3-deoxy-D-manno-octulosonic acid kinase [Agarivorans sp. MS3-6]|uniref:3-deoxy-D-manno-octulosonic acid kinase n=1 Tax=Agarivorans sp. TSD2052 TaxID=2937286 RepID=UPI00200EBB9E|nr:3-deoxy-D-manno-octulosonic acid kinase [Agarivorans sp. TSD2052]UPW18556.1 3-deoxy-D-manno-octulosonic acid kinase [Agarivorans sp. TSD2052]
MQIEKQKTEDGYLFFNPAVWDHVSDAYFEVRHWQQNRAVVGHAMGRGKTIFFRFQHRECVLRHYHRGGLVSKLSNDRYLYTSLKRTRVWREFSLLMSLKALQLPAPLAIAGRIKRSGMSFQADLILERIDGAKDLAQLLSERRLPLSLWQKVGETIALFHKAGVYHADLNLRNIMVDDQQKVWLIDFDSGRLCRPRKKWQQANIARLYRSLEKEQTKPGYCHWLESDWQYMLAAYKNAL